MTFPSRSLAILALASSIQVPAAPTVVACTTAVVSRGASATGRAMLWKNRDADGSDNQVVFLTDGKLPYVGLVNRGDAMGLQIWAGVNAAGFAIMSSASYNLESGDTSGEGTLMSPLVAGSLALRGRLYPETRGERKRYMDRRALSAVRSDALPLLLAAEEETFREVEAARAAWRKASPTTEAVKVLSETAAGRALKAVEAAEVAVAKAAATR